MIKKLDKSFYLKKDVVKLSRDLLGKFLCTNIKGQYTSGMITETEAYAGEIDKASHAFGGRRTNRTEIMYAEGGISYVYLCYGIHHLFNIVTNVEDVPHAILIRAIKPVEGLDIILKRRNVKTNKTAEEFILSDKKNKLAGGPGTVSQALGIQTLHTGIPLSENTIWVEDRGIKVPKNKIIAGPRIGVDYAGEDAKLPYRFILAP